MFFRGEFGECGYYYFLDRTLFIYLYIFIYLFFFNIYIYTIYLFIFFNIYIYTRFWGIFGDSLEFFLKFICSIIWETSLLEREGRTHR